MIRSFGDKQTEMIFQGNSSRTLPPDIQSRANMKLFRIDQQWRILFRWSDGDAHEVRIADYH